LVRGWLAATDNPPSARAQRELEQAIMPRIERVLAVGQTGGTVRTDLPSGLLIAVALDMGRAMDMWLLAQPLDSPVPAADRRVCRHAPQCPGSPELGGGRPHTDHADRPDLCGCGGDLLPQRAAEPTLRVLPR
jgi:hypothetical protein